MKRSIRLREFGCLESRLFTPSELYVEGKRHLTHLKSYQIQTDENAFMCSGRDFKPDYKICFIGGSFVENKFVDQDSRWFSHLEKLLLENGRKVRVLNAGYSGATSLNILNTILNKVVNNNFEAVYYCISSNDYSALSYDYTYWNTTKNHSNLLLSRYDDPKKYNLKSDDFIKMIRSIHDLCRNFNINIYFMTYPNLCNNLALTYINNLLRKVCQEFNYTVIDTDFLMQSYKADFEKLFHDQLHLNEEGSKIFAKTLLDNHFCCNSNNEIRSKLISTKAYTELQQKFLLVELDGDSEDYSGNFSLIIDISNQDLKKDKLLIQLVLDDLGSNPQKGFEFSKELGWHSWVDICVRQLQVRCSFILNNKNACVLKISLDSQRMISEVVSNLTLEAYRGM